MQPRANEKKRTHVPSSCADRNLVGGDLENVSGSSWLAEMDLIVSGRRLAESTLRNVLNAYAHLHTHLGQRLLQQPRSISPFIAGFNLAVGGRVARSHIKTKTAFSERLCLVAPCLQNLNFSVNSKVAEVVACEVEQRRGSD